MCKDKHKKGDEEMTPQVIDKEKLWEVARKQTKTNAQGQTVISKEDDILEDDTWDKVYAQVNISEQ